MDVYKTKLSKFLSFVLRHAPDKYELHLDRNGYADLGEVLDILKEKSKRFTEEDLFDLVKSDPKGRFEVAGKNIRATYGHSVDVVPKSVNTTPPEILYHGTSQESLEEVLDGGLKPMGRCFVHLSLSEKEAYMVGLRHTKTPIMLEILAKEADLDSIKFYKEGKLFLVERVPAKYIKVKSTGSDERLKI